MRHAAWTWGGLVLMGLFALTACGGEAEAVEPSCLAGTWADTTTYQDFGLTLTETQVLILRRDNTWESTTTTTPSLTGCANPSRLAGTYRATNTEFTLETTAAGICGQAVADLASPTTLTGTYTCGTTTLELTLGGGETLSYTRNP